VSILAINPDDGRLKWHYQQVPWELWDYTATANMVLADLTIAGKPRKVIMQVPKNGYYYVLDRETGEFISAKPIVFTNWATGIDSTGRPMINPAAIYQDKPAVIFPTQAGAHNWQPMAFSPMTGLAYIPAREQGMVMLDQAGYRWTKGDVNVGSVGILGFIFDLMTPAEQAQFQQIIKAHPNLPPLATKEVLIAWDPIAQKERWRMPLGDGDWAGGGVLTTAGNLVIQGKSSGHLVVYNAENGQKLHEIEVGTAIMAAPVSYEIGGEQYVAVLAGFGGAVAPVYPREIAAYRYQNYGRILAFKLGGGATPLPPARPAPASPELPADLVAPAALGSRGEPVFLAHAGFDSIVLGGKLASSGMASFADLLRPEDVAAIHAYLIREQRKLRAEETSKP
jgi:quinohemoprotein ethanol dehydrogenase